MAPHLIQYKRGYISTLEQLLSTQKQLIEVVIESGGELTPEIEAMLDSLREDTLQKVDSTTSFLHMLEDAENRFKIEAERFATARRSLSNLQDRIRERIKLTMMQMGANKLEGNMYDFTVRQSTPALKVDNAERVPSDFQIVTIDIDRGKIKDALKKGEIAEGCRLEHGLTLSIRASTKSKIRSSHTLDTSAV